MLVGDQFEYRIVNSIPRFTEHQKYSETFGFEWKKWSRVQFESENTGRKMAGHTEKMFDAITGLAGTDLKNKLVVEFGCGSGRFIEIVKNKGGTAVGLDMSLAVESARENFRDDPDVLVVQGDLLNPPFKRGAFDVGYSIGVLHHTPDPAKGLEKLAQAVRSGGRVACCVYAKDSFYDYPSVHAYRKLFNATKGLFGNKLALGYAYFSAYFLHHVFAALRVVPIAGRGACHLLEKYLLVNLPLADPRWRLLDVFDAITPHYASTHTPDEVRDWFLKARCTDVSQTPWGPTSFIGIKGA